MLALRTVRECPRLALALRFPYYLPYYLVHLAGGERGGLAQRGGRGILQGPWRAIILLRPAWGGRGAQPRGCSEPARPMGGHNLRRTGRTALGGTGSPAQGFSERPARPMGGHHLRRTGRTGLGGTGSPAQGVFGASCQANGGPSSLENRAHRPGGDGESSPGGVRSILTGQWGAIIFGEPGAPA